MVEIDYRGCGSAKKLEGDVYVLCFFVGTPDAPVDESVHGPWGRQLLEAEEWLQKQAARWGKRLAFKNASYGMNGEITLQKTAVPVGPETPNAFYFPETVYKAQRFKDGWDVSEFIRQHLTDSKQWISIIFCNTRGRPFACPVNERLVKFDGKKFFLESCVIFRYGSQPPYPESTSASFAHEILHLFGASDLYAHNDAERASEAEYRRRYPRSIMLGHPHGLQHNDVDEITAWLVGWGKRPLRL